MGNTAHTYEAAVSLLPKGEIMVKRVSILFNTDLRKQLEQVPAAGWSKAMAEAMYLIHTFLVALVRQKMNPFPGPRLLDQNGNEVPLKFFNGGYAENSMLVDALKRGARVEIVVSKVLTNTSQSLITGLLVVEFAIYSKAKENCLGNVRLSFRENGTIASETGGFNL